MKRFNSRFTDRGTEAVDAFSQDWGGNNNWLVPPPYLIPHVIQHLLRCRAKGILITPHWPSNRFWPFIFSWKGPRYPVRTWQEIWQGARHLQAGDQPGSIFTPDKFRGGLMAVWLDASL